jgi:transcription initiation factor TFIIIB Brf1 subunit/transcription initiation factor TFIIB
MSTSDRALTKGFQEITSMADFIPVPKNIVDRANYLFKQVYEKKILKGRAIVVIATACLLIVCQERNVSHLRCVGCPQGLYSFHNFRIHLFFLEATQ